MKEYIILGEDGEALGSVVLSGDELCGDQKKDEFRALGKAKNKWPTAVLAGEMAGDSSFPSPGLDAPEIKEYPRGGRGGI